MRKDVSDKTLTQIAELYNVGISNPKGIASKLELNVATVNIALRYADSIGLIKYKPRKHGIQYLDGSELKYIKKAVYCITTNEKFDTITQASMVTGCSQDAVSDCCNGKRSSCIGRRDKKEYVFKFL